MTQTLEQQLDDLRAEALAPGRTPQQRAAAQTAFNNIANAGIENSIANLQQGTQVYQDLSTELAALIQKIQDNTVPDIIGDAADFVTKVNEAVQPQDAG